MIEYVFMFQVVNILLTAIVLTIMRKEQDDNDK